MTTPKNWMEWTRVAVPAALEAGAAIMDVYAKDFKVAYKDDQSPLTDADHASHDCIVRHLHATGIPVVSEESEDAPYETRAQWPMHWLVDPLDGTKEFVKRNGDFTVNIALIDGTHPVFGVVYAPVAQELYVGIAGVGSYRVSGPAALAHIGDALKRLPSFEAPFVRLPVNQPREKDVVRIVMSKSHLDDETRAFLKKYEERGLRVEAVSRGSSIKLCLVAAGEADLYPRLGPTMEWDTAAAHAVVEASGGAVWAMEKKHERHRKADHSLAYNKSNRLNPSFKVLSSGWKHRADAWP